MIVHIYLSGEMYKHRKENSFFFLKNKPNIFLCAQRSRTYSENVRPVFVPLATGHAPGRFFDPCTVILPLSGVRREKRLVRGFPMSISIHTHTYIYIVYVKYALGGNIDSKHNVRFATKKIRRQQ